MSADRWSNCPRCVSELERRKIDALAMLDSQYGRVDRQRYKELEATAARLQQEEPKRTFREDYEFHGASEGAVTAEYSGSCTECGLKASFEHTVTFWPEPGIPRGQS